MTREEAVDLIKDLSQYSAFWKTIYENIDKIKNFDSRVEACKDNWELTFTFNKEDINERIEN